MIRIVSYNVHACIGSDGRFEPARIADVLHALAPDIIALQEVEDRVYLDTTVSAFLAAHLGMSAHHGSTLHRGDAPYGNLLLARQPAADVHAHDLSVPGGEPRGVIEARFELGDVRLRLLATHLGLRAAERTRQARQLVPLAGPGREDLTVLVGDINEWRPLATPLRTLAGRFDFHSRERTFPARMPMFALDRIYVSPGELVHDVRTEHTAATRLASDHLPLVCDLVGEL